MKHQKPVLAFSYNYLKFMSEQMRTQLIRKMLPSIDLLEITKKSKHSKPLNIQKKYLKQSGLKVLKGSHGNTACSSN